MTGVENNKRVSLNQQELLFQEQTLHETAMLNPVETTYEDRVRISRQGSLTQPL